MTKMKKMIATLNGKFIYSASEPLETFMGSDTKDVIDKLFNAILQRFEQA